MSPADKFEIFIRLCFSATGLLGVLKITSIISISWWWVFLPILIAFVAILRAFK
jgi:hypothetical protein